MFCANVPSLPAAVGWNGLNEKHVCTARFTAIFCRTFLLFVVAQTGFAQVAPPREPHYELVLEKRIADFRTPLKGLVRTTDGGYVAVGAGRLTRIVSLNQDLNVIFDKNYDFSDPASRNYTETRGAIATPDGGILIFGRTSSRVITGEAMDVNNRARWYGYAALVRADGTLAWVRSYFANKWSESIERCALVQDGYYCAGTSVGDIADQSTNSGQRITTFLWLVKIGFDGAKVWSKAAFPDFRSASWFNPLYSESDGSVVLAVEFGGTNIEHKREFDRYLVELLKFDARGTFIARHAYDQWGTARVAQTSTGYAVFIFGRIDQDHFPSGLMSLPRLAELDGRLREVDLRTVSLDQVFPVALYSDPKGGIHLIGTNQFPATRLEPIVAFYSERGRLVGKTVFEALSKRDAFAHVQPGSMTDELVLAREVRDDAGQRSAAPYVVVTKVRFARD
jgi:hypothetical protein